MRKVFIKFFCIFLKKCIDKTRQRAYYKYKVKRGKYYGKNIL